MQPVDVRGLLGKPGSARRVKKEERIEGLEGQLGRVPAEDPVRMELLLESVVEGILASGPVSGRMRLSCARCLVEFDQDLRVDVSELFVEGEPGEDARDEDTYPVREGAIDLEPMIRDAVLLTIPFSPLCRSECRGLCERCGGDRNRGECTCTEATDPRWSALAGLEID